MKKAHILLVDDDATFRLVTRDLLAEEGYAVDAAASIAEAQQQIAGGRYDLVLCDLVMEKESGLDLLRELTTMPLRPPVLMITGFASVDSAVEAMKTGAEDYLTKPCSNDALLLKIERTLEKYQARAELERLRREMHDRFTFGSMIGRSAAMQQVMALLEQIADTDASVLITGETGTGKEMVARALHQHSRRAHKPFIGVNCAALTESLLESELFGHEKGAFTGALAQKPGRFERADGGTLFLDEIGSMSPALQAKLLRVLQERHFERVGGTETISVDIRLIAATNTELKQAIKDGLFREDLYYRLNVIPVHLPPLRERAGDIPLLAQHFVEKHTERLRKPAPELSPAAAELLMARNWPGNVRELENVIERAVILCREGTIHAQHLLLQQEDRLMQLLAEAATKRFTEEQLCQLYARMIYAETGENKKAACDVLNINYRTLQNRLGLD